jgi:hypothetical protein
LIKIDEFVSLLLLAVVVVLMMISLWLSLFRVLNKGLRSRLQLRQCHLSWFFVISSKDHDAAAMWRWLQLRPLQLPWLSVISSKDRDVTAVQNLGYIKIQSSLWILYGRCLLIYLIYIYIGIVWWAEADGVFSSLNMILLFKSVLIILPPKGQNGFEYVCLL